MTGSARSGADAAEHAVAFTIGGSGVPAEIEIRVNFGLLTGREATPAEIERLARGLLDLVERVTVVSETRYEIDRHSEAAVHQVRIAVEQGPAAGRREELELRLIESAEKWARRCAADRAADAVRPG